MMVFDDIAKRKIRFQTRRGLLELDLIFGRFMEKEFEHLSDKELSEFSEILEFQDQELLALINGHSETDKGHLIPMLEKSDGHEASEICLQADFKMQKPSEAQRTCCGCSNVGYNLQRSNNMSKSIKLNVPGQAGLELFIGSQHRARCG